MSAEAEMKPKRDRKRDLTGAALAAVLFLAVLVGIVSACSTGVIPKSQKQSAVGIYKSSAITPDEWQHVATIHGWLDDLDVCLEIVEFLKRKEPGRYLCRPVNDDSGKL